MGSVISVIWEMHDTLLYFYRLLVLTLLFLGVLHSGYIVRQCEVSGLPKIPPARPRSLPRQGPMGSPEGSLSWVMFPMHFVTR
ncbi:hypothetical protein ABB37_03968 [Leptomonas pyrrhocoris]|uniref:Uncharacterized protein n=1 Tax=Leptomonas pyrrhocoris TaxID=157538 RepID=A0A0M9G3S1_LEPPY|nr:hypothetical protein ABB37_03968 [Leptomonas pyrrhocoris]KPA81647.1 hypothetical protein ABB37_03968 [Leptomonas pyrrhocoris]|eukprot:XP_015660086.1 hypothetical protein ABB37_03968 [Leptomonas pyrrhocoris]